MKFIYSTKFILSLVNPNLAQNSFLRVHFPQRFLSLSLSVTLFSHPEAASYKADLLPFLLIKCNSIPHAFFTENIHPTFLLYTEIFPLLFLLALVTCLS